MPLQEELGQLMPRLRKSHAVRTYVDIFQRIFGPFENLAEIACTPVPEVDLVGGLVSGAADDVLLVITEPDSIPGGAIDEILEAVLQDEARCR